MRWPLSHWPEFSIAVCGLIVVVVGADLALPGRLGLVLAFVLVFPGAALVRLFGLDDPVTEITLSCAVSISLALAFAGVFTYSVGLSSLWVLLALVGVTIAANGVEVARGRPRRLDART